MLIKWLLSRESAPPTLESSEVLCKRKFWHTPKTSHLPVAVLFISPRCSDGFDRHRSEWLTAGCNTSGIVQVRFWCITQCYLLNKWISTLLQLVSTPTWRGGAVAAWLVELSPDRAVRAQALAANTELCLSPPRCINKNWWIWCQDLVTLL